MVVSTSKARSTATARSAMPNSRKGFSLPRQHGSGGNLKVLCKCDAQVPKES